MIIVFSVELNRNILFFPPTSFQIPLLWPTCPVLLCDNAATAPPQALLLLVPESLSQSYPPSLHPDITLLEDTIKQ